MSVQAMSECWGPNLPMANEMGLRPATIRLVALAVADVVNDAHDNEFYGSVTKLAAKVGLSRQCVGQVLKHLCDAGVLSQLEERPGGTTKYRWVGVTTTLSGSYPQPDNHGVRYLTTTLSGGDNHVVTNPIEPKRETQEEPTPPKAARLATLPFPSDFGGSGEAPAPTRRHRKRVVLSDEGGKPPVVRVGDVMDTFKLEWSGVCRERPEFAMVPVYATEKACHSWLRTRFFAPKDGKVWKPEEVLRLVEEFMRDVRYGAITPKAGVNAWQMFQSSHTKYIHRVATPDAPMSNYEESDFAKARREETRKFLEGLT